MGIGSAVVWLTGLICGPLVVVGVVASAVQRRRDRLIATTGERATGRIVAVGTDTGDMGDSTHWVEVQYDWYDQSPTVRVTVTRLHHQQYRVGKRIGLTYAPSRPQVVKLDPPN
jgi:hypothetical protein